MRLHRSTNCECLSNEACDKKNEASKTKYELRCKQTRYISQGNRQWLGVSLTFKIYTHIQIFL